MLSFVPLKEIQRIRIVISDQLLLSRLLSDIFRINTLYMIMQAGSGHIGSSFSAMDIVTWLWTQEMKAPNEQEQNPSDTYFSSKGHDVPGLYSVLIGLEKLDFNLVHKLRRLGGLPGHPDVGTPYMVTNTGPLGMGISKAHGMAIAHRQREKSGRFYVLTGDGELQEGQFWESLHPTANGKFSEITVIIDHNKIQSDTWLKETSDLGNLEIKLRSFGWEVARCDGHDFESLQSIFLNFRKVKDRPQILIADTVKGKGVSFMEKMDENGFYNFHSGAPSAESYIAALKELKDRVDDLLKGTSQPILLLEEKEMFPRYNPEKPQKLVVAYGDELVKIAHERKELVAMDADLVLDTGLIPFKKEFPDRYFECGIAEQDMVSQAGGMALHGLLPVVHSFACFLSTRPNEQIYNNASEQTKIIYVGSLAGLLPAVPGHSHQSVRDISAVGGMPGLFLLQPANEKETRMAIRWAVEKNSASTYLRLTSVACENLFDLPVDYCLELGKGVILKEGKDALLIAYGPVMLGEAIKASHLIKEQGIDLAVVNLPWLNNIDEEWLKKLVKNYKIVFTLDDHYTIFGQGTLIGSILVRLGAQIKHASFGIDQLPVCGHNSEVLEHHGLDSKSIVKKIVNHLKV